MQKHVGNLEIGGNPPDGGFFEPRKKANSLHITLMTHILTAFIRIIRVIRSESFLRFPPDIVISYPFRQCPGVYVKSVGCDRRRFRGERIGSI